MMQKKQLFYIMFIFSVYSPSLLMHLIRWWLITNSGNSTVDFADHNLTNVLGYAHFDPPSYMCVTGCEYSYCKIPFYCYK